MRYDSGLSFEPPLGFVPQVTRVTNLSRQLGITVRDVEGREHRIGPGETIEGRFVIGAVAMGPKR